MQAVGLREGGFSREAVRSRRGTLRLIKTDAAPSHSAVRVLVGDKNHLFREEAVAARLQLLCESEILRVAPPWTRAVLVLVASILGCAVVVASVGKIEQTSHARGIVRVVGGSQLLTAQTSGAVLEVRAHSGDSVRPGDVIATIDSATVRSNIFQAEREIARARGEIEAFETRRRTIYLERRQLLRERIALLASRARSQSATVERLSRRGQSVDRLQGEGLASGMDQIQSAEDVATASREKIRVHEEIAQTRLQLANLAQELDAELLKLKAELRAAEDRRDALAISLEQTTIRAPLGGRLEAVLVKPGDVTSAGTAIGRIVPEGVPLHVVAFLPERDRAFVRLGGASRVELDQLPASEFGHLDATIARVSQELASAVEIRDVLGDQVEVREAVFRVELELRPSGRGAKVEPYLRSGSLAVVRTPLRERRIVVVLFEPFRKWIH